MAAGDKEENLAPGGKKFVEILIQLTIGYIALLRTKDFGLFTPPPYSKEVCNYGLTVTPPSPFLRAY